MKTLLRRFFIHQAVKMHDDVRKTKYNLLIGEAGACRKWNHCKSHDICSSLFIAFYFQENFRKPPKRRFVRRIPRRGKKKERWIIYPTSSCFFLNVIYGSYETRRFLSVLIYDAPVKISRFLLRQPVQRTVGVYWFDCISRKDVESFREGMDTE